MSVRISNGMMIALVMTLMFPKAIGLTQGTMAREVYGDIWLSTIIATLQGLGIMLLTVYIIRRRPERNLVEQAGLILGKWAGLLTGFVLFLFFIGAFTTVMITFVYHIMDYFLPEAPTWIFSAIGLSVCAYGLFLGLEVISRTAFLSILSIVGLNILVILGSLKQMDIRELQPLFMSGVGKTVWASRHNDADWAMATLMVGLLLPQVDEPKEWGKAGAFGVLLGGSIVVLWPILEGTVITPEMTAQYIVSCMQLARSAEIGVFLHRYEMIMIAMFIMPLFVQLMLCLYCAAKALSFSAETDKLKYFYAPVLLVGGAFSYYIVDDHMRAVKFTESLWPPFALSVAFGLPVVLLAVGFIGKRKQPPSQQQLQQQPDPAQGTDP